MHIFDEADEVVILVAGGLCLAVSKRIRWGAVWHWEGCRVQARSGRC